MNIYIKENEVRLIVLALRDMNSTLWQNAKETSNAERAKSYLSDLELSQELLNYLEEELLRHERGKLNV
jgi:hypothetical protein